MKTDVEAETLENYLNIVKETESFEDDVVAGSWSSPSDGGQRENSDLFPNKSQNHNPSEHSDFTLPLNRYSAATKTDLPFEKEDSKKTILNSPENPATTELSQDYEEFMRKIRARKQQFFQQTEASTNIFNNENSPILSPTKSRDQIPEKNPKKTVIVEPQTQRSERNSIEKYSSIVIDEKKKDLLELKSLSAFQESFETENYMDRKNQTILELEIELNKSRRAAVLLEEKVELKEKVNNELREKLTIMRQQLKQNEKIKMELNTLQNKNIALEEENRLLHEKLLKYESKLKENEKESKELKSKYDQTREFAITVGNLASEQEDKYKRKLMETNNSLTFQQGLVEGLTKKLKVVTDELTITRDKLKFEENKSERLLQRELQYKEHISVLQEKFQQSEEELNKLRERVNEGEFQKVKMALSMEIKSSEKLKEIIQVLKKDLKEARMNQNTHSENSPSSPIFGALKIDASMKREISTLQQENHDLKVQVQQLVAALKSKFDGEVFDGNQEYKGALETTRDEDTKSLHEVAIGRSLI